MGQDAPGASNEAPFDSFVRQFLHSKINQRLSRRSQEIYQHDTQLLIEHLHAEGLERLPEVETPHIEALAAKVIELDEGSRVRAARVMSIARLLFAHGVGRSMISEHENPMNRVAPLRVELRELHPEENPGALPDIERIPADTPEHLRDRSLLRVMYLTGIWMGGLVALNRFIPSHPPLCTVFPEGVVRYRSKGGLMEHSLVDRVSMEWLDQWNTVRHRLSVDVGEEALWVTRQGGRILRSTIASRIRKHSATIRINPITDHLEPYALMP